MVTRETALYAIRKHLSLGGVIAILILVGVSFGQWNLLIGILGITSNGVFELLVLYFPILKDREYGVMLVIAISIIFQCI